MKLVKPWYRALYDFFFQSAEDHADEMERCRQAQANYYRMLGNLPIKKSKRPLRNISPHHKV